MSNVSMIDGHIDNDLDNQKMTDEQIIKALKYCLEQEVHCKGCPYEEYSKKDCTYRLYKDTLDLINRQKTEIERLQKVIETMKNEQLQR